MKTHHHSSEQAASSCSPLSRRPRSIRVECRDENEGRGRFGGAFTLIELLVVIGIIAILAGMLFAVSGGARQKALVKRAQGELAQLATAIDRYKLDQGFYPPDNRIGNNPVRPYPNSLYYELGGASYDRNQDAFTTLRDGEVVSASALNTAFNTRGINNAVVPGNTDGLVAKNYLPDLKPSQHVPGPGGLRVLGVDVTGATMVGGISPFSYVSSNPTNNPSTFDLWVDIFVGDDIKRISNWSEEPELVSD